MPTLSTRPAWSRWEMALWMVSTSTWLDDAVSCDLLEDKARVLWAARIEAEEVIQ